MNNNKQLPLPLNNFSLFLNWADISNTESCQDDANSLDAEIKKLVAEYNNAYSKVVANTAIQNKMKIAEQHLGIILKFHNLLEKQKENQNEDNLDNRLPPKRLPFWKKLFYGGVFIFNMLIDAADSGGGAFAILGILFLNPIPAAIIAGGFAIIGAVFFFTFEGHLYRKKLGLLSKATYPEVIYAQLKHINKVAVVLMDTQIVQTLGVRLLQISCVLQAELFRTAETGYENIINENARQQESYWRRITEYGLSIAGFALTTGSGYLLMSALLGLVGTAVPPVALVGGMVIAISFLVLRNESVKQFLYPVRKKVDKLGVVFYKTKKAYEHCSDYHRKEKGSRLSIEKEPFTGGSQEKTTMPPSPSPDSQYYNNIFSSPFYSVSPTSIGASEGYGSRSNFQKSPTYF